MASLSVAETHLNNQIQKTAEAADTFADHPIILRKKTCRCSCDEVLLESAHSALTALFWCDVPVRYKESIPLSPFCHPWQFWSLEKSVQTRRSNKYPVLYTVLRLTVEPVRLEYQVFKISSPISGQKYLSAKPLNSRTIFYKHGFGQLRFMTVNQLHSMKTERLADPQLQRLFIKINKGIKASTD